jgi:hypothetical protein
MCLKTCAGFKKTLQLSEATLQKSLFGERALEQVELECSSLRTEAEAMGYSVELLPKV